MTTNLATLAQLKSAVGMGSSDTRHDTELQAQLDRAAALLEEMCNRPLDSVERVERFFGDNTPVLALPYPVQASTDAVVRIRRHPSNEFETVAAAELEEFETYNPRSTSIHWTASGYVWPRADFQTVEVTWTTGYDDGTNEAAPTVITHAVLDIAAMLWRARKGSASTDGPISVDASLSPFVREVIRGYKTVRQTRTRSFGAFAPTAGRVIGGRDNLYFG